MCFIFHKWSKWESYNVDIPARKLGAGWYICSAIETRLMRRCFDCGDVQDKMLSILVKNRLDETEE
jgi:hypothetical protein